MNDIKYLIENEPEVRKNFLNQKVDLKLFDQVLELYREKNDLIGQVDQLRTKLNQGTKGGHEISALKELSKQEKKISTKLDEIQNKFNQKMLLLPNLIGKNTPVGQDEKANIVIEEFHEKLPEGLDHETIMKDLDLLDIERAVKISGSRFYFLKNEAVELEYALVRWVMDEAKNKNFTLINPPVLIKREIGQKAGHPEVNSEDAYHTAEDDLYLIGSAEHSLMGMHGGEIIEEKNLPIKYLGFSTCFRREAGSYGRDVKGILRTHQFDKLELVIITAKDQSDANFEELIRFEKYLVQKLELPFRVIEICSGDIGHSAHRQNDLEIWFPSQKKFRETHSCSNCTDYQTRGLNIRMRTKKGKVELAHALNATAFAIGRILIAIVENNYDPKSKSIKIPEVLHKYLSFSQICKI